MFQNAVRDGEQDLLFADRYGFDIFYFKWKHIDDQVDVAVQKVVCQFGGIALDQL